MPREIHEYSGKQPACGRSIQAAIGQQLRAVYEADLGEPLPERIAELVARLARGEAPAVSDNPVNPTRPPRA